jgi:hypothetical protein
MRVASRKWLWMVAGVVTAAIAVVALSVMYGVLTQEGSRYRHCGHRPELKARLLGACLYWQWIKGTDRLTTYLTIHGCSGDRAVDTLTRINFMQRGFQAQSGRYAHSLSELAAASDPATMPTAKSILSQFRIEYETVHENWCAYIPKQADLPGHYLVLSSGVYFCETRRPTTNDTALAYFK